MKQSDVKKPIIIIDFDSTFVSLEGLDELAAEALAHVPDRQERLAAIQHITNEGMSGRIDFQTSLQRRFIQLHPTAEHVDTVAKKLVAAINPSFARSKKTIQQEANRVWVVSGGFRELIEPVTDAFGIDRSHVLANTFVWDKERKNVVDYDHTNVLAGNDGKVAAVRSLHLNDDYVIVVGDGMTDYAVYAAGLADTCIAFTETVQRPELLAKADYSSDDIQFALNFTAPAATSLSRVFSAVTT